MSPAAVSLLLSCLVLCSLVPAYRAGCPWNESGLKKWSEASTWASGVPADNSEVVIPAGTRVLLDVQPASLATLTIEATGALIWGNVAGLVLNVHYIWVKGEFHMGSETCRLPVKAHIKLHGNSNDKYHTAEHEFGRKFFGIAPGGVLELHGEDKTSWTKLAQTVRPIDDISCAMVYDHADFKHNHAKISVQTGLNGVIWNEDGSLADMFVYKSKDYDKVATFFASVPDGKVIGLYTYGEDGVEVKKQAMVDVIKDLGGSRITDATDRKDSFALLVKKGSPETAKQSVQANVKVFMALKEIDVTTPIGFLALHDHTRGLVFQVAKDHWTVKRSRMFRVLHEDAAFPVLTLTDEVTGWNEGDEVLLTSTDYEWQQAETRTIVKCDTCSNRQVRLNDSLAHLHYGNFTYNVDERGEVAMLSRSILIEGVLEDACTERTKEEQDRKLCKKFNRDTFGGHLMAVRGFKTVHIDGVQLLHLGQQMHRGAYPMHFHMCDDVPGAYVRNNTVIDSFSRCVAVHGTHHLKVLNNVCWMHLGHGIFLEDSVEQHNQVIGNLVAGTLPGQLLLTDMSKDLCTTTDTYCDALSSFWLTHPNNDILGNVAAGGEGKGFMYVFADIPLGPSRQRQKELNRTHNPKEFPIHFSHNVAHSNKETGMHIDEKISTGTGMENKGNIIENGLLRCENEYDPHINGKPVWVNISKSTFYKNGCKNMWIKGGNIRISQCALADSKEGLTGGTTLFDTGTQAYKTIFMGETENLGAGKRRIFGGGERYMERSYYGEPTDSLTAVSIYQGPLLIINCFFDKYNTVDWCVDPEKNLSNCPQNKIVTRHAGAISFKRASTYPSMTSSYTLGNTFGFCDNVDRRHWVWQGANGVNDWSWRDGNLMGYFMDKDGHLTGTVNGSIMPNFPLYSGDECQPRDDWGLLVCPYRYVKLEIAGSTGSLSAKSKTDTPFIIRRDDAKYSEPFSMSGEIRNEWLLRSGRSYMIDFNKKTSGAAFPSELKIFGYGVEKGDEVRVGICQPKDVTHYEIMMEYPAYIKKDNATMVSSLSALDNDKTGAAFFHDKVNGVLFFKLMSFHTDNNETQRCPDGKCWRAVIRPQGSTKLDTLRSCADVKPDPFIGDDQAVRTKPTTPDCPGIGTPEGLGPVDLSEVNNIVHKEYSVECKATSNPADTSKYLGCFKEKLNKDSIQELKTQEEICLFATMNPPFCINRCYNRGYKFAALARGSRCTCSNTLLTTTGFDTTASDCAIKCVGDGGKFCGGKDSIGVWDTGYSA